MGQATLDLPDPLDASTMGASPSADDLLSQLAGDEIDRMLADSDVDRDPAASADAAAPPLSVSTGQAVEPATDIARQATPAEVDPEINAQLDALFEDLTESPARAAQPAAPELETNPQPALAGVEAAAPELASIPQAIATSLAEETPAALAAPILANPALGQDELDTLAERAALTAPLPEPEADPRAQIQSSLEEAEASDDERRLPLLLRPLEWINAPFAALPDPLRETLGKIGLLTLFNAVAVLAYVLIFRRHKA